MSIVVHRNVIFVIVARVVLLPLTDCMGEGLLSGSYRTPTINVSVSTGVID